MSPVPAELILTLAEGQGSYVDESNTLDACSVAFITGNPPDIRGVRLRR